jgi:alkaline phosphatase D
MDWFIIGDRADRNSPVTWTRSLATTSGTGKLHEVDGPVGA